MGWSLMEQALAWSLEEGMLEEEGAGSMG